jgi:disulfide bond formation protein DsbB
MSTAYEAFQRSQSSQGVSSLWTWAALLVSLVGAAGSLWLSIGLDLVACPLCFYQRALMLGVSGVFLVGLLSGRQRAGVVSLLALPLTIGGLGVAGMHVAKELNGELECPPGVVCQAYANFQDQADCPPEMRELATAPRESLTVFALLFLLQLVDILRSRTRGGFGILSLAGGIIVGSLITAGLMYAVKNQRPIPLAPKPLEGCRKPA